MRANNGRKRLRVIGWREWVALPDLQIGHIKAKVDTGARSSALHAFHIETFRRAGCEMVRFSVHPLQRHTQPAVLAEAMLLGYRTVRSSTGTASRRPVILTTLNLLGKQWPIELTLAGRDEMGFRLLLGRQALRGKFLVDPNRSYFGEQPRGR